MREIRITVVLESGERRLLAAGGEEPLADVLAGNGIRVNTRCGRNGLCGGCEVELREGTVRGGAESIAAPARIRACRARLEGPATIFIPARSRLARRTQTEAFDLAVAPASNPLFPAEAGGRDAAFAVDIGTTTVDLLLVDLVTGDILSRAGGFNAQLRFGDNVIARIAAAGDAGRLAAMKRAIVNETIGPLLTRACGQAGRGMERIAGGVVAGNTTMLHLLVGEDPTPLGVAPFAPRFIRGRLVDAAGVGLDAEGLPPGTPIRLLPGIAAYVGADIMAGAAASALAHDSEPSLLVDIGTNGEIALQAGGKLTACATAAGPAFEGCDLRCGMPAQRGAVDSIRVGTRPFHVAAETIGGVPIGEATGICGSAYVDFLATARSGGLLREAGRFDEALWSEIPSQYRRNDESGRGVNLRPDGENGPLYVCEADVAALLQAKAAIGAGIEILLDAAGIRAAQLGRVYLAGGFGMHLNIAHAIAIGLLPGVQAKQARVMGNAALAGAYLALIDQSALDEMEKLRARWEVVELNLADRFEERYIEHMLIP